MIVHIAGLVVQVGNLLRQRCAWCGATLIDYDLDRVMVPIGQPGPPATWPEGAVVLVDGPMSTIVEHGPDRELPSTACAKLDPGVTL